MKKRRPLIALLVVTAIWGMAGPVIKFTLGYLPPFTFLALRMLLAGGIVLPALLTKRSEQTLKKEGMARLIALSLLGQPLSLGLLFWGYSYTSSLEGTIIGATFPVMLALAGALFLKETVTRKERIGIALTIGGTMLIIFAEPLLRGNPGAFTSIKGNVLVFLSNISWLTYILLEKKRVSKRRKYHFEGMAFSFLVAFFAILPLAIGELTLAKINLWQTLASVKAWCGLLYMAGLSSVVAYLLYDYALAKVEASETGVFSYLQPLFALPLAYFLLQEKPTIYLLPGVALILAGFWLSERGASYS